MESIRDMMKDVTIEDLRDWAGDIIYERGKDYVDCVDQLSRTADGTLVARVSGTREYATWVRVEGDGDFICDCTCPYDDGPCKHAVAVLLKAAKVLRRKNAKIPLLAEDDDLFLEAFTDCDDDWYEDDGDFTPRRLSLGNGLPKKKKAELEKLLKDQSRDQLLSLVLDLAAEYPEIIDRIGEKKQLESGQVTQLSKALRKEIRQLTAEEAWYNHWKGYGSLPDYSHLEKQLRKLLQAGHADVVLDLGGDLWTLGNEQVGGSNDDGMTAEALGRCLDIVITSVPKSSLTAVEQILWLIEHELADQYGLLGDVKTILNEARYSQDDWHQTAPVIEKWLKQQPVKDKSDFSERYYRERLMEWLRDVYMRAGEVEKIIPLLEREADSCQSYETLVKALRASGEIERARNWCKRGYQKTSEKSPGIASALQIQLREMAADEKRYDLVAAYLADDFMERPSQDRFLTLRTGAEKISAWPLVREQMLTFLQTGVRPQPLSENWPLPEPEVRTLQDRRRRFPDEDMLIEIALLEKRFDDAVAIYSSRTKVNSWNYHLDDGLADAVAATHPDVALRIWRVIANEEIARVQPKAYKEAAIYLRKMHKVYKKTKRVAEWEALILELRIQHKAKRRLMEVLDGLTNRSKLI